MTDNTDQTLDEIPEGTLTEENGDYNPESINYDIQDTEYVDDADDTDEVEIQEDIAMVPTESEPTAVTQPSQDAPPSYAPMSPGAVRSPSLARSPGAAKEAQEYDPMAAGLQSPPIPHHETLQSPPAGQVNDTHPGETTTTAEAPQAASSAPLPKSVDLQALIAGLVPARTKLASNSPPQTRDTTALSPPSQPFQPPNPPPPPAMTITPDIMYQLQSFTSPPPQSTSQFQQPPSQQQQGPNAGGPDIQPDELALTPAEESLYERFLENERDIVQNARWDQFPSGSRMFIGNLPSERIEKKHIFRIFYPYGRLAQISIKQAYGFVQFYKREECEAAIRGQQGMVLTGRKVHLEVSKPQKGREEGIGRGGKRNRSPLGGRDRSPPPGKGGRGRARGAGRYEDYDRGRVRARDSPPAGGRYHKDGYGAGYSRSRSRSPPAARYGSPPPRRGPSEPPEVALLVRDDPDKNYIYHVEDMFEDRRIRTDTIFVSPRASVPELTKQLVLDGVLAVCFLSRALQDRRKVSMQTFQRNPTDPGAIKWDGMSPFINFTDWLEYNEIDIPVAVDLVAAIKRPPQIALQHPPFTGYPAPTPYAAPLPIQPVQQPLPAGVNPNLASIIGNMNPSALQQVFGALAKQPASTYAAYGQPTAAVPGMIGQPAPPLQGFGGQPQRPQQQPTQQVQDIMAQLAALSKKS